MIGVDREMQAYARWWGAGSPVRLNGGVYEPDMPAPTPPTDGEGDA